MKKYITTTLPYINADPHIGFAFEAIRADIWARFERQKGNEVFFNTGTDEHGLKIYQQAKELKMEPQAYCDKQAAKFKELGEMLNLSYDNFIRTTDKHHILAAQEFWRQTKVNGYIYKKHYKIKYCVGCELEKTESELVDGKCVLHPNQKIKIIDEENYFFKFSSFQKALLELYKKQKDFVVPSHRFNEIKKFVERGLEDFSVSRLKSKMPWGIAVPDDKEHVMYVWFDALANYISAIGYPDDMDKFKAWWPAIQVAGKDNLRQQSAMWQAMLMAINQKPSKKIFINSFLLSNGQKMSKSFGNVISPKEMAEKFGTDGTRYLLANLNSFGDDIDITWQSMTEKYNADLANGLGNLVQRTIGMITKYLDGRIPALKTKSKKKEKIGKFVEELKLDEALKEIWQIIALSDIYISEKKPWQLAKDNPKELNKVLGNLRNNLLEIASFLIPFMPETAQTITETFSGANIKIIKPLFPRLAA